MRHIEELIQAAERKAIERKHTTITVVLKDGTTQNFSGSLKDYDTTSPALGRILLTDATEVPKVDHIAAWLDELSNVFGDILGNELPWGSFVWEGDYKGIPCRAEITAGPQVDVSHAAELSTMATLDARLSALEALVASVPHKRVLAAFPLNGQEIRIELVERNHYEQKED